MPCSRGLVRYCAWRDFTSPPRRRRREIENAIAISFVQPFDLRPSAAGKLVLRAMPGSVRRILLEQEERAGVW
jgi:hypothetical protein